MSRRRNHLKRDAEAAAREQRGARADVVADLFCEISAAIRVSAADLGLLGQLLFWLSETTSDQSETNASIALEAIERWRSRVQPESSETEGLAALLREYVSGRIVVQDDAEGGTRNGVPCATCSWR